ncbi:two-component system response regulator DctR [Crenobacter luteus]|uniref:LuxR family transcriptional regulator n=1 Tax=Crenobacter luteus TaxID=1452487 RepID=A0A163D5U2_9NEIS|nr:response regulator [Crenobacter luteus]KZE33931.1 hypothetical protein AVW16_07700 [Crenobacter luteus]TCP06897.1 two-component system response regulator DctR [Crenobacter luteus]
MEKISNATIHILDDDAACRASVFSLLKDHHYSPLAHADVPGFWRQLEDEELGCLVLDLEVGGQSGLALLEKLRARGCRLPVIFLTARGGVASAVRAIKLGACGFLEKPLDPARLLAAVEEALCAELAERERVAARLAFERQLASLSGRESEVFERVLAGKRNKCIAEEMGVTVKTVEVHRGNVMRKMRARTIAGLVRLVAEYRREVGAAPALA